MSGSSNTTPTGATSWSGQRQGDGFGGQYAPQQQVGQQPYGMAVPNLPNAMGGQLSTQPSFGQPQQQPAAPSPLGGTSYAMGLNAQTASTPSPMALAPQQMANAAPAPMAQPGVQMPGQTMPAMAPQTSAPMMPGPGGEIPQQQPNDRLALNAPRRNGLFG